MFYICQVVPRFVYDDIKAERDALLRRALADAFTGRAFDQMKTDRDDLLRQSRDDVARIATLEEDLVIRLLSSVISYPICHPGSKYVQSRTKMITFNKF